MYRVIYKRWGRFCTQVFPSDKEAEEHYRKYNGVLIQSASEPIPDKYSNAKLPQRAFQRGPMSIRKDRCQCGNGKLIADVSCTMCSMPVARPSSS